MNRENNWPKSIPPLKPERGVFSCASVSGKAANRLLTQSLTIHYTKNPLPIRNCSAAHETTCDIGNE